MEMTNEEICRSYRQAKDKNEHIARLADLNLCEKKTILDILSENGEITGVKVKADVKKKKKYGHFPSEIKEEIIRLSYDGVPAGKIAEMLGYTPEQIYSQLKYMRQKAKAFRSDESKEKAVCAQSETVDIEEQLRKLKNEDVVIDLTEMFCHLKNLFLMMRELEFLECDLGSMSVDTLAIAGESLCDTYINRLEEIIASIV